MLVIAETLGINRFKGDNRTNFTGSLVAASVTQIEATWKFGRAVRLSVASRQRCRRGST